jgi:hypothetical protein
MKFLSSLCTTAGLVLLSANSASAHSPEEIAARCVETIHKAVERCTTATAAETQRCVITIRRLRAAGNERAAHRVARECVESLTNRMRNCVTHIQGHCDRCVEFLLNIGQPKLARRVDAACDAAVAKLRDNLNRAKNAIRSALNS